MVPPVLYLLNESSEAILDRATGPNADLLWSNQPSGLRQEHQAALDEAFGQLPDVRGQGDGTIVRDSSLVFPRLGDGDDGRLPQLSRDLSRAPGAVDDVQQRASGYRAEVSEHLVGDPVGPRRFLHLQSAALHRQCFHAKRGARLTPPAPAFLAGTQLRTGQLVFGCAVQHGVSYLLEDPRVLADERFCFGAVGSQRLPTVHHRLAVAELVVAAALPLLEGFVDPSDVCWLVEGG